MRSRLVTFAVVALALAGTSCGEEADPTTTVAPSSTVEQVPLSSFTSTTAPAATAVPPSDYAGFRAQATACGATAPDPVEPQTFAAPEDQSLEPGTKLRAVISTSCGDITVELDPSTAPATVNSFVFLARAGYFDGTVSHRLLPGFVLQAGDPTATGTGGPGYVVPDEYPSADFVYTAGVLAMANAGSGSTGSQFFIMLADAGLPPQFSVFGNVVDGFDVLQRIAEIDLGPNVRGEVSVPLETLYLERVTIVEG